MQINVKTNSIEPLIEAAITKYINKPNVFLRNGFKYTISVMIDTAQSYICFHIKIPFWDIDAKMNVSFDPSFPADEVLNSCANGFIDNLTNYLNKQEICGCGGKKVPTMLIEAKTEEFNLFLLENPSIDLEYLAKTQRDKFKFKPCQRCFKCSKIYE